MAGWQSCFWQRAGAFVLLANHISAAVIIKLRKKPVSVLTGSSVFCLGICGRNGLCQPSCALTALGAYSASGLVVCQRLANGLANGLGVAA